MKTTTLPLPALVCLAAGCLSAAEPLRIPLAAEQEVKKKTTAELRFDLPAVAAGQQVRLSLRARVQYPYWCANNVALTLTVNDHSVVGVDLLNKPLEYHCKNGRDAFWATERGNAWLLFTWPDFDVAKVAAYDSPYAITETDPFALVWDITAYARPGANTVRFTHPEILPDVDHALVLRDVAVELGDPVESRNLTTVVRPAPTGALPTYVPRGRQPVKMQVELSRGGAIRVKVGRRSCVVATRSSEPGGQWHLTGTERWQPVTGQASRAWPCAGYRVSRTVKVEADHLHVADTFTNTGDALVGVMLEHTLRTDVPPLEVTLGGRPPFARYQREGGGANPTAVGRWPDMALGLAAEDDIFRAHVTELQHDGEFGLADHELGLEAGGSQTLEWSLYPLPGGDYWAFINALRRNWGANLAIPGPHVFVDWSFHTQTEEWYRHWVRSRGVTMVTAPDAMFEDGKPAMGTAIPLAKPFCERTAAWFATLHRAAPEVKSLFYLNCTLCTEPGAAEKYADSRLLDPNGNQQTMSAGCRDGGYVPAPLFVSTLDNSYGKAMMQTARYIVEELKPDGIYHDIYTSAGIGARAFGIAWDGCTVRIDPSTHAVTGKCASAALLERGWHVELMKYLRERGKILFGNGPPETRTGTGLRVPTFVETYYSAAVVRDTHLGTPWGYGNLPWVDPPRGYTYNTARNLRKILEYGGVIALPGWSEEPRELTFLQLLYPLTPLEIRPGMVLGEERILTSRSGRYGWPDGGAADVHEFDGDGKRVAQPGSREVREGGRRLYELRMPSDHFAIVVRRE
ncbi:MAG: hypothetical protein HYU66_07085 [Armatimonadetes bacterium]|nr:hypothetical protein [Armatimonadota bacterium]